DQLAAQQLEALFRAEDTDVDQLVVLRTAPASRADRVCHERDATSYSGRRQCVRFRIPKWGGRSAATLGLALDGPAGLGPAIEADREVGDVRESHLAEHVGRQGRALAAGTIHDDPLRRIDLARIVMRGRVEPELEHAAGHVRRAGNEPELAPLADVA